MASRKPAASTVLKEANAKVAELTKKLETAESYKKWAESARDEAKQELEGVHAILNVMPGALPQKKDDYGTHQAGVRLASYLASK